MHAYMLIKVSVLFIWRRSGGNLHVLLTSGIWVVNANKLNYNSVSHSSNSSSLQPAASICTSASFLLLLLLLRLLLLLLLRSDSYSFFVFVCCWYPLDSSKSFKCRHLFYCKYVTYAQILFVCLEYRVCW